MRWLAVVAAISIGSFASLAHADVTLGALMPTSGKGADYGLQEQTAIAMFLDKYADLGGAGKLKVTVYDTRGEIPDAISLTRKLIDSDKVTAIIGPYFSGESEVAFPIAVRAQMPIITPTSAKPGIAAANRPWAFRNAMTTDKIDAALVDHWLAVQGKPIKSVVILVDSKDAVSSSDGKQVFPAVLKARGINVLDIISFQTGDIDYSAQVTRAKGLNPDGIVVTAIDNEAGHVVQEIRKQGMTQPIVAGLELLSPHFLEIAGSAANGLMTGNDFYRENPDPTTVAWVKEFNALAHEEPTQSAALMYDTLYLTRDCIMRTSITGADLVDRTKLRDCWAGIKDVAAPLTGKTTIDGSGDAVRKPVFIVVENGQFTSKN
jgi:branched-chain amino acid transport system substrate-binding protein